MKAVTERGKWVDESTAGRSPFAIDYEEFIAKKSGGRAFELRRASGDPVRFDGVRDGYLIEAKGEYEQFTELIDGERVWSVPPVNNKMIGQMKRQLEAAEGAPIRWYFHEESMAKLVAKDFAKRFDQEFKNNVEIISWKYGASESDAKVIKALGQ